MSHPVGIDLGTTNSVIAYVNSSGHPEIILNAEGKSITPSVVYFGCDPPLVGERAKEMQALGESEVASFFKRSMGDPQFLLSLGGRDRTAVELSALILQKLKADAEAVLRCHITQAVITVPAYFNNLQRQATIEAGRHAGLEVLQIINEPTAAALAYRMHETGKPETVLVYDLGGGTFDVSLVRLAPEELTVMATTGDHNLGGKDWDDRISSYIGQQFFEAHGVSPLDDPDSFNDLLVKAENIKKTLSARDVTRVTIHYRQKQEAIELSKVTFEDLTRDLMERTQRLVEQVLEEKGLLWQDVSGVLLVGGSTRMPMVHNYVSQMSGKKPLTGVNVDEAVALGAAVAAARSLADRAPAGAPRFYLGGRTTRDVMSHSLGLIAESADRKRYLNSIILPKNQPIPFEATRPYQLHLRPDRGGELDVYVTQGESEEPLACTFLGRYHFTDIQPSKDGTAILDIAYSYDQNGVVQVSARERGTERLLPMTVEPVPEDMSWLAQVPSDATRDSVTAYLAFDLSGSMSGGPLREAKEAARAFVGQTDLAHNSLGLVSFADRVHTDIEATQNAKSLEQAIGKMRIGAVGGGNDASPFAHLQRLFHDVAGHRYIIVLTDGVWSDPRRAIKEAKACAEDNIQIIAIGFGWADKAFLSQLATSEKGSYFAQTGELVKTFSTIAQELTETAGSPAKKKLGLRFF